MIPPIGVAVRSSVTLIIKYATSIDGDFEFGERRAAEAHGDHDNMSMLRPPD